MQSRQHRTMQGESGSDLRLRWLASEENVSQAAARELVRPNRLRVQAGPRAARPQHRSGRSSTVETPARVALLRRTKTACLSAHSSLVAQTPWLRPGRSTRPSGTSEEETGHA